MPNPHYSDVSNQSAVNVPGKKPAKAGKRPGFATSAIGWPGVPGKAGPWGADKGYRKVKQHPVSKGI